MVGAGSRQVLAQDLEAAVDGLDAVSLPGVTPDGFVLFCRVLLSGRHARSGVRRAEVEERLVAAAGAAQYIARAGQLDWFINTPPPHAHPPP